MSRFLDVLLKHFERNKLLNFLNESDVIEKLDSPILIDELIEAMWKLNL